jgi:hypothetical protein
MLIRRFAAPLCLVFLAVASLAADEKKPDPRENIGTLIPHGIKLMEAKKYKEFMEAFVPPADLARMKESGMFDEIAKKFGEGNKATQLLAALKEVNGSVPEYNDDKTEATFKLKTPQGNKKSLDFKQVGTYWVLTG